MNRMEMESDGSKVFFFDIDGMRGCMSERIQSMTLLVRRRERRVG